MIIGTVRGHIVSTINHPFYDGKKFAALYFAHNVLPGVALKAQLIAREDRSALDIPAAAFAPA